MHRTEGTNHLNNYFTNGPPGTRVEQNWLNAIQEEIAYVIEQAGITMLTASTDTRRQLKAALDNFYTQLPSGTVMLFGQNLAPTGWTRKIDWQDNAMICISSSGNIGSGGAANPQDEHHHWVCGFDSIAGSNFFSSTELATDAFEWVDVAAGSDYQVASPDFSASYHAWSRKNDAPYYQEVIAATKD